MNKKINVKISILIMVLLCICTGCSAQQGRKYTTEDLDNLAEIRIYSAENDELVKTISDEEQLYKYNQCSLFDDDTEEHQNELKESLEGKREQYYLISYKYPVSHFGEKELEENTTITLYENTNIVKMVVAGENIKALSISEELLTFYYELSDEEMEFYHSLVE